jgi:hypothetical protein
LLFDILISVVRHQFQRWSFAQVDPCGLDFRTIRPSVSFGKHREVGASEPMLPNKLTPVRNPG